MFDWQAPFSAAYEFFAVEKSTLKELRKIENIKPGGTIERNLNTAIKASGKFNYVGSVDLDVRELLRVYLIATDEQGQTERVCLGTFLTQSDTTNIEDVGKTGEIDCFSVLKILDDDSFSGVYKVDKGTNALNHAKKIVESVGLKVEVSETSNFTLGTDLFFNEQDTSKLGIINKLLTMADFASAMITPDGKVQFKPYEPPKQSTPVYTFEEGIKATFLPHMQDNAKLSDVHNVVIVTSDNHEGAVVYEAVNDDPLSPSSTVNIGRRIVRRESVSGLTTEAQAKKHAERLLANEMVVANNLDFKHVFHPLVDIGRSVAMRYETGEINRSMIVQKMSIALSAGALCATTARRFINV